MALQNRYEFLYYVACTNANPNGDPDMGNMPRIDPQTMQGFITDVATKRRIRNYIEMAYEGQPGMGIFVQKSVNLNRQIALVNPKIIVCLGRIAAMALIREDFRITREHGQWFDRDGRRLMATYHPSALLRDVDKRPEAFMDLRALRKEIKAVCSRTY